MGDKLILKETKWDGLEMSQQGAPLVYTGRTLEREITCVTKAYGMQKGWVILGVKNVEHHGKADTKQGAHLVIKRSWIEDYANKTKDAQDKHVRGWLVDAFENFLSSVCDGKPTHSYIIVNRDEPYAQEVLDTILRGEVEKQ